MESSLSGFPFRLDHQTKALAKFFFARFERRFMGWKTMTKAHWPHIQGPTNQRGNTDQEVKPSPAISRFAERPFRAGD